MKTSIVIATYERQADLIECVDSLHSQFERPDEIIIVDDGDLERTRNRLAENGMLDDVTHIGGPGEGRMASRNVGVANASGDIVCFLDDDVILPPIWLREVVETYERNEDASGVGGHVLNFNPDEIRKANMESLGYRALTAFRLLFLHDRIGDFSPIGVLWAPHTLVGGGEQDAEAFQGCNMTFRSEVFEEYEFDEWYGATGSFTCEELDICARLADDGRRLVYNPRATVVHKRSTGPGRQTEGPDYANVTNLSYFLLKNPRFGVANFLLFACLIAGYAVLCRDPEYVRRVVAGLGHYARQTDSGWLTSLTSKLL